MTKHNHYFVDVEGLGKIDVYRVIELFGVTCPVAQHILKKSVAIGNRGHKDLERDWEDIRDSAVRKLAMLEEDKKTEHLGWNLYKGSGNPVLHPVFVDVVREGKVFYNVNPKKVLWDKFVQFWRVSPNTLYREGQA